MYRPIPAYQVGMALEAAGDERGAIAAYRRADQRGDAHGAWQVAVELESRETWPAHRQPTYARWIGAMSMHRSRWPNCWNGWATWRAPRPPTAKQSRKE
ncbi:hypothetical protein [Nonomuraea sp. B19D2]|uniref:hypothetical protein n=1 Tax=Nonomuraea sp. B19D2 TaxID=3159561 RepID=UPI0032DADC63